MKKFILLFSCFLTIFANAETIIGKVVSVADGDTITVLVDGNHQEKVRFWGIDAPEKSQDFGQVSKQYLSNFVYGKTVTVDAINKDQYGRHIGKVYVAERYINLEMVKAGLAWHYVQYAPNDLDIATAERDARVAKVGLWAQSNPTPPWNYRKSSRKKTTPTPSNKGGKYWVSGSGKVHNQSCRYYGSSDKGIYTESPKGVNCKVCGGNGK